MEVTASLPVCAVACAKWNMEVSMTDLHETSDLKYAAQIDGVGWMFVAFVVVITATAAMVLSW